MKAPYEHVGDPHLAVRRVMDRPRLIGWSSLDPFAANL